MSFSCRSWGYVLPELNQLREGCLCPGATPTLPSWSLPLSPAPTQGIGHPVCCSRLSQLMLNMCLPIPSEEPSLLAAELWICFALTCVCFALCSLSHSSPWRSSLAGCCCAHLQHRNVPVRLSRVGHKHEYQPPGRLMQDRAQATDGLCVL